MTFKSAALNYSKNASTNDTRTVNGMVAHSHTSSAVLDFFSKVGSYRGKDLSKEFMSALAENQELAIRALLWARDIRAGAGERQQFRDLLKRLEKFNPHLAAAIMHKIPELGRWDDIFSYEDSRNVTAAYDMLNEALFVHRNGLAAKWMPRKGPVATAIAKYFGMSPRVYRKLLATSTKVVESQMCAKEFSAINFSHVPSVASARYQKAFGRNAPMEYGAYISELKKPVAERDPKVKVNAGAVYPYEVIRTISNGNAAVADAQWDALPNYVGDSSVFSIVDTSGSMGSMPGLSRGYGYSLNRSVATGSVNPIEVSVSLGLYTASKNKGAFKDLLMIFDSTPKLLHVKGTLQQRLAQMPEIVAGSTNLEAAFDMLLNIAVKGKVVAKDMPATLLILSDMQFNQATRYDHSAMQMIAAKYARAGYAVPKIVFWNLSAHGNANTPVKFDENGTALISGFSPAIMKSVLSSNLEKFTPYNVMVETLSNERYNYK